MAERRPCPGRDPPQLQASCFSSGIAVAPGRKGFSWDPLSLERQVVWEDLGHGWKQIVGVRALSRQVGGQAWGRGQQRARVRLRSGHLWRSAPRGEPAVSPACFAHRAQRQGRLEVETWGETLGHTLTREEEMPDADRSACMSSA